MTKLSDTQSILLTAAAQRADGNLLPLPGSLRGGAATKVVAALLARGLAEERIVESTAKADPALNTLWRNADDGRGVLLRITAAGLDALGIEAGRRRGAAPQRRSAPRGEQGRRAAPRGRRGRPSGAAAAQDARGHQAGGAGRHARARRRARPSPRSSRRPAGSRTRCAAPSPAR